jgi:type I restriction enzyme S subunit
VRELPSGWIQTELDNLLSFVIGGDWGKEPNYSDEEFEDVYCIRGTEFKKWRKEKGASAVQRRVKNTSLEKRELLRGDILIEISGGGPDQPVGRTLLIDHAALNIHKDYPKVCTNFLRLARPYTDIDSAYLNYYLHSFYLSGEVKNYQGGSNNLRNLKFKDYNQILIPTAPLNEQSRIADKLDSTLAKVDAAQARLDKIPNILKRFRQSVLAAATSGELIDENADSWDNSLLASLLANIADCPHSTPKWTAEGKICVRTTAFKPFHLDLKEQKTVSQDTYNERTQRLKPKAGDILYSREGAILGIACQIPKNVELCLGQRMIVMRAGELIDPQYLTIVLNSPITTNHVKSLTIGNAAPRINMSAIKKFEISHPILKKQKEIVRRVESLFTMADTVEKQYKDAKDRTKRLTQSILAKAFRGELVPQDSNDEPADKLLERIKNDNKTAVIKKPKTSCPPAKRNTAKSKAVTAVNQNAKEVYATLQTNKEEMTPQQIIESMKNDTFETIDQLFVQLKNLLEGSLISQSGFGENAKFKVLKL